MEKKMEEKQNKIVGMRNLVLTLALIFAIGLVSAAQCNDGIDNELDGNIDYPNDTGCTSANDNDENVVLGYADGCFVNGDKLYDVFGNVMYSCNSPSCSACVAISEGANYTTSFARCSGLPRCGFNSSGGNGSGGTLDLSAPNLTIFSPVANNVYNSKNVLVNFSLNERADVYYRDLDASTVSWKSICSDCRIYSREKSFNEGINNIEFKARDGSGNIAYKNISFTVDSKAPKIRSVSPTSGFVSSVFEITFDEENPIDLTMHFGNDDLGFGDQTFDLEDDCEVDSNRPERKTCSRDVDLGDYDGSNISYWFTLTDIANTTVNSKAYNISVDETAPVVNNPNSFYSLDFEEGDVDFLLNITELNFDEAVYIVQDSRPLEKRICNKLVDGICERSISFVDGNYNLTVIVRDKAGNEWTSEFSFLMDSKAPKIMGIEPKKGFADGNFEVSFKEKNPEIITLFYGNESKELNVEDCNVNLASDRYICSTFVDLSAYDGGIVGYHFVVEDKVGNSDESSQKELDVDTTFPVVNNLGSFYSINGNYVFFSLSITEENFDEASYEYVDSNGKIVSRRICSRLNSAGFCEKKFSFKSGTYNLTVNVIDSASNKLAIPANFVV